METTQFQRAITFVVWAMTLQLAGTLGYFWLEGWPLHDSFYMTAITWATVGYGETRELTSLGRFFTVGLICASVITIACVTGSITSMIVQGEVSGTFIQRKALRMAKRVKNHTIVCGAGKVAAAVIDKLLARGEAVIAIDDHHPSVERLRQRHPQLIVIQDSPTDELVLAKANVLEARHIVAATERDFDNLMIAMTCREVNSKLRVFAVCQDTAVASRLAKIGVLDVICPYQLSGQTVAESIGAK